jgi:hypothetical protein
MKKFKKEIFFVLVIILLGQIIFAFLSGRFTTPRWDNRIYATTGIVHDSTDLQKLNEAAHYFGQTMIGWTKFPNFLPDLIKYAALPEGSQFNAHMQERQNIIFTVTTPSPIEKETLLKVKDFIQNKLDEYNDLSKTKFLLSNMDYEQVYVQKTYAYGAMLALVASMVIALGFLYVKREFVS